jgi:hypothetical protein
MTSEGAGSRRNKDTHLHATDVRRKSSGGARRALVDSLVAIARDFAGSVYPLAEEGERKRDEGKGGESDGNDSGEGWGRR